MAAKRIDVLIYSGTGSTSTSVQHCIETFRSLLSMNYAVKPVTENEILNEPWNFTCAILVMPGGADLGYCQALNGKGSRHIKQYVEQGGSYLGFCAGAYYGSGRCEFEAKSKNLGVVGNRELAFFPGTCRGLAFPGFAYNSDIGARAAELRVSKPEMSPGPVPMVFRSYYNGGGVFVDASRYYDKGIEVLAEYTEYLEVDGGDGNAAVIYCKVGDGGAILCNTHPEFDAAKLDHDSKVPGFNKIVEALEDDNTKGRNFLRACLSRLGLAVNPENTTPLALSKLHLSSAIPSGVTKVVESLQEIITERDGLSILEGGNDAFYLEQQSAGSIEESLDTMDNSGEDRADESRHPSNSFLDLDESVSRIKLHYKAPPTSEETPDFSHQLFYENLQSYNEQEERNNEVFGNYLLYGNVVTSTSTLLEKNTKLLSYLPLGFTATAARQTTGRGRGSNVWVSPPGSLMFSIAIRRPIQTQAPVIFLQYVAALAIVQGIKTYGPGYEKLPIKLKWPNDIYAPTSNSKTYVKIGGILVNCHYTSSEILAVVGIGLNTTNAAPTTCLNALNPPAPFTLEKLLARILVTFSALYKKFSRSGFDKSLHDMYYEHWLHSDQIVTLENEGGVRAKIKGITTDWGLLIAEEVGWQDRPTGRKFELQSDSNSFDFMKGLICRKGQKGKGS